MKIKRVLFIVAMQVEAQPLIDHFSLTEDSTFAPHLPACAWIGEYKNLSLMVVVNGKDEETGMDLIGTQAATLSTHVAIETYHPHLLINAGTAGGFGANGSEIGDIYLSHKEVVFHDRRVPVDKWERQCIGYYPVWDVTRLAHLGFKTGVVTTGNSLDMPPVDEQRIKAIGGEVKDMEAAAVAWVAKIHQVPMFCVKAITDLMDSGIPTSQEFQTNLNLATQNLREACFKIVEEFTKR